MKKVMKKALILGLIAGIFTACNNDDNENNTDGQVKVSLTDAPFAFDFVDEANIDVAKIELKNTNGEYTTVFEGNASYNMVNLNNGITASVNNTSVEAGTYDEARITLSGASVILSNSEDFDLDAAASGAGAISATIEPALVVEAGQDSEILLDLDISNSFQFTGMGGINLPNWISSISSIVGCDFEADFRAVDLDQTGTITGTVTTNASGSSAVVANAYVHIEVNGEEVAAQTDANGEFTLIGITEGSYTVHAETESGADASVGSINVSADATATCNIVVN